MDPSLHHSHFPLNILFICSRNQWRSPTAEAIWRKYPQLNVRSAGTSPRAKRTVSSKDIAWAQVIFAMEHDHKKRLTAQFKPHLQHKTLEVLDIPDQYQYMDPELVSIFEAHAEVFLAQYPKPQ